MAAILVSTWEDGLFVFEGGAPHQELAGQSVQGLARDVAGNPIAIVGGHQLCRRTPEGKWITVGRSGEDLSCCVAVEEDIHLGTYKVPTVMRLHQGQHFEPLPGFDTVSGKDAWYAGTALVDGQIVGPPLGLRSIAATCDGKTLLANVNVGGIPRSVDCGETWHPTIDLSWDVHQVCAHPTRSDWVAAATALGLAISADGGELWSLHDSDLYGAYCSAVAFVGDQVLVAASADHFALRGAVYRFDPDRRGSLTLVGGGLPQWLTGIADTGNIAVCGAKAALVDGGGNLYSSDDRAATWTAVHKRLPYASGLPIV